MNSTHRFRIVDPWYGTCFTAHPCGAKNLKVAPRFFEKSVDRVDLWKEIKYYNVSNIITVIYVYKSLHIFHVIFPTGALSNNY
jgi:hypothetical protein